MISLHIASQVPILFPFIKVLVYLSYHFLSPFIKVCTTVLKPVAFHQNIRVLKLSFGVPLHQSTRVLKVWFPFISPLKTPANPVVFQQSIRVLKLLFPVALHQSIRVLKLSFWVVLHQRTRVLKLWFPFILPLNSPANPVTFLWSDLSPLVMKPPVFP